MTLELIIAEVVFKKDNTKVLKLTVNNQLGEALRKIAEGKLEMTPTTTMLRKVKYSFIPHDWPTYTQCNIRDQHLYMVSDLTFYEIVLHREGMMDGWCYLCNLGCPEFQVCYRTVAPGLSQR